MAWIPNLLISMACRFKCDIDWFVHMDWHVDFSSSMHHVLWIRSSGYEVVDTKVMVSREEEVVVNMVEVENVRVGDIEVEAMVKVVDIGVEVVVVMDTEMVDTEVMDTKVDTVVVEVVTREKEVVVDTKKVEEVRVKYIEVEPWWKKKKRVNNIKIKILKKI